MSTPTPEPLTPAEVAAALLAQSTTVSLSLALHDAVAHVRNAQSVRIAALGRAVALITDGKDDTARAILAESEGVLADAREGLERLVALSRAAGPAAKATPTADTEGAGGD